VAEGPFGIRLLDVGIVVLVIAAVEINVIVGSGPGAVPLGLGAYLAGALVAVPILFRHRWPFPVLIAVAIAVVLYYLLERRNISPAPVLFFPVYDAALAGYLVWAIVIPAAFMLIGLFVVEASTREGLAALSSDFLPQIVVVALAVMLGEVVRSRRALTIETATRLRLADEERAAEAGRLIAEERLRIARELHDTVAHSMATITVQAGSSLHLLSTGDPQMADADTLRGALAAIRETSKEALTEMRSVLGQLRGSDDGGPSGSGGHAVGRTGLHRLPVLRDAVTAAGARVAVTVVGDEVPLAAEADHAAYRILQESLTNVLRHAGPGAAVQICLGYQPEALVITVADDGRGSPATLGDWVVGAGAGDNGAGDGGAGGHGIRGMRERAASVGGELVAGPCPEGGFRVTATLPTRGADATVAQPADGGRGERA
jgi:signal transduction histidine kinase